MRLVKNIKHPAFGISIFSLDDKYLVQVEYGPLVQGFKFAKLDLQGGVEELESKLDIDFQKRCLERFKDMASELKMV